MHPGCQFKRCTGKLECEKERESGSHISSERAEVRADAWPKTVGE